MSTQQFGVGPLAGKACVTSIMTMSPGLDPNAVPDVIERDRVVMAARPGLALKLLPVLVNQETGQIYTGGAYLFDDIENATAFYRWCRRDFFIAGVQFEKMPGLMSRTSKVWEVIGAENFKDLDGHQCVMRMEEWRCNRDMDRTTLKNDWNGIREAAINTGLASVWLLYNDELREFGIVTTADRAGPPPTDHPDVASLTTLAQSPSLAERYAADGAEKIFDRASFVFTVWFPVTGSPSDRVPLWPNSPPLPGPG